MNASDAKVDVDSPLVRSAELILSVPAIVQAQIESQLALASSSQVVLADRWVCRMIKIR